MIVNKTYKCSNCGEFNIEIDINNNLENCPKCGRKVNRVFKANVSLNFKDSYNSTRK